MSEGSDATLSFRVCQSRWAMLYSVPRVLAEV
jgi:hypothetical protein